MYWTCMRTFSAVLPSSLTGIFVEHPDRKDGMQSEDQEDQAEQILQDLPAGRAARKCRPSSPAMLYAAT